MGLDAKIYVYHKEDVNIDEETGLLYPKDRSNALKYIYFRKFYDLQDYMWEVLATNHPNVDDINCTNIPLYEHELEQLKEWISDYQMDCLLNNLDNYNESGHCDEEFNEIINLQYDPDYYVVYWNWF